MGVAEDICCCFQRSKEDDYLCQIANIPIRSGVLENHHSNRYKCIFAGKSIDCRNTSPRFELRAFPIHIISAILLVSFSEDDVEVGLDDGQLNTVLTTDV